MHQTALISCLPVELALLPLGLIIQGRMRIFLCLRGTYHSGGHTTYSVVRRPAVTPQFRHRLMDQEMPRSWNGEDPARSDGPGERGGVTNLTAKQRGAERRGQSLAVGKDLCRGAVFSPTGLAWIWPVCVRRCVCHPACPGWDALVTRSCGGVSGCSDSSIQAHSFL